MNSIKKSKLVNIWCSISNSSSKTEWDIKNDNGQLERVGVEDTW